ncbi:ligand-binding sensor domain-containing diguanylate cyclase [Roseateles toxinivorans]|uniref:diguanylate cyclase n=1 Tax=Roseateles toxinivorans TaxID=270368 RepID=A0A4V3CSY0_9BURK|nr:ligand-binding sensor domain-containing diguanylate cyclase [Roseateles toxinivorans]TDP62567.1 diguanylate cyclase (GGDEF)-like protein [Roseateles toxinivorans]
MSCSVGVVQEVQTHSIARSWVARAAFGLALLLQALAGESLALPARSAAAELAPQRWAGLTELSFRHLRQEQGLPNEIATAVAEDGDGFLWVGTLGGLARWDGYRFKVYKADGRTAGALPDNVIQTLHGDAAGRLWIGTSASGLVRYDGQEDRFVRYPVGPQGLSHVSVRALIDDGAGGLWVGTEGGLDHLDPATGQIRRLSAQAGPGLQGVRALLLDRRGTLWVGTQQGLYRRAAGAGGFVPVGMGTSGAGQPDAVSLFEDSRGSIWVGSSQHGAFIVEGSGLQALPVQESSSAAGDALRVQPVVTIVETRQGEVWLGTLGQGIVSVDLATRLTRRIRHQATLPVSLPDNAVRDLYRDRSGLMWVASNRGLSRHDPSQAAILTMFGTPICDVPLQCGDALSPASTEVSWILPMPDGRIWLATHTQGVLIVDPSGARVAALSPDASRPDRALPPDIVLGLELSPQGQVFIATKRGLYRANAEGTTVERVRIPGRDPRASTWALLADGDTLWIGGETDGLWRLDLRTGKAAAPLRDAAQQLTDQRVIVLARGPANQLWIGTRNGLNRYDTASGVVTRISPDPERPQGLSAGFVTALFTDAQSRLWVGTYGGGVNILERLVEGEAPRFRSLAAAQGLPDDSVNALLADAAGQIWVSTDNGLATVDPRSLAVRSLKRAEGVEFLTYWTGSAARTAEGELLFGGAGGMTIVRPERLAAWTYRPPVRVTDLRIGGQDMPPGRFLAAAGPSRPVLPVSAQANSLVVEFAAMDYSAPERNRYAYRLEGFESTWVETDASRRLAAYTNLPPGSYRLLLRGSNRDGTWSETPLALPVRVQPAWHQTLWFRAAALLTLLLAMFVIVQVRTRWLRARQRELELKVSARTAELERVSEELQEKSRVLELASISDPLTGLYNRRFLAEHIEPAIAASLRRARDSRPGHPVDTDTLFFLIDIDHFKRVNDLYGHAAGDAVLVHFCRRLQAVMRASDYLVRWGGEEFLAVARDTDRARAEELAERIRAVVADSPFVLDDGRTLNISCSIGFACLPFVAPHPLALCWQDVVKLADMALLGAKRAGRNSWVGLSAAPLAQADLLLALAQVDPHPALRSGDLLVVSNRPAPVVMRALSELEGLSSHAGRGAAATEVSDSFS